MQFHWTIDTILSCFDCQGIVISFGAILSQRIYLSSEQIKIEETFLGYILGQRYLWYDDAI
jgi:hypothetical protein